MPDLGVFQFQSESRPILPPIAPTDWMTPQLTLVPNPRPVPTGGFSGPPPTAPIATRPRTLPPFDWMQSPPDPVRMPRPFALLAPYGAEAPLLPLGFKLTFLVNVPLGSDGKPDLKHVTVTALS